ncbi:hypothetical protein ACYULU_01715 [Breznakiellaceae bacterium SP9]
MKKLMLVSVLFSFAVFANAQQVPPNWDTNPPRDTDAVTYSIGISQPAATEQAAFGGAWQNALQNFAVSIGTYFKGQSDITVQSQGYDSEIEDAYTLRVESASFSTEVQISGMRELARKTERQSNGMYIARVLTAMNSEDYRKAAQYIENEEAAFLAYRFFQQKIPENSRSGLPRLNTREKPHGYPDYYTWLRNTCITITVRGADNPSAYMEQVETFAKKLYRSILVFPETLNGQPARIMYDAPRYYDGIVRSLQNMNLFTIARENAQLTLSPLKPTALENFRSAAAAMKDSSKVFVTGLEIIQTQERRVVNTGNLIVTQFRNIASRQFNMQAVPYTLPAQYLNGEYLDEDGIINHISRSIAAFPARYAVLCYSETTLETGFINNVIASSRFTLYDVLTGETFQSDTVDTIGFVFALSNFQEQSIITESRRALQFLYDVKNRPGLAGIIAGVLGNL